MDVGVTSGINLGPTTVVTSDSSDGSLHDITFHCNGALLERKVYVVVELDSVIQRGRLSA